MPPAVAGRAATVAAHNAVTVTTAATPARPRLVTLFPFRPPGAFPRKSNRLHPARSHPFR